MPLFSRHFNSGSNPAQSDAGSQHVIQPQGTYKRFTISVPRLFRRSRHTQAPAVEIRAFGIEQAVYVDHEQHGIPRAPATPYHGSFNPFNIQIEGRNPFPNNVEPVTVPVAAQFQGAQSINISGHSRFTNIGTNTNNMTTTANYYGGTRGLEELKDFVSFAALHDSSEQDPTRCCHPGTRKSVLNQLRDWLDHPDATEPICWLHGPAGAGKSAIAQTIAHEYKKRGVVATFFFHRPDAKRNDGNRLFPTLAWQLAFSIPIIKDDIVHALDETPHLPTKGVEAQFEQLVAHPFHPKNKITAQMPQPAPVIIIDGLDECSDEQLQWRILTVIGNAVKDYLVPLRFLIGSRPEALIEDVLYQFRHFTLRIDLATLDDSNRDIEKYLVDQFSDIASKHGLNPTWPGPEIIEEFVFKSSGNFIFAATVIRYISDEDSDPEEQLDIVRNLKPRGTMSPFAILDELYLEILKRQRDQDFLKTFLALFVGRSSIKRNDLHEDDATLMNVSEKKLHMKLRRMRSLLKFEPFIDVYHKSFLDFLQDLPRSGQYHVSNEKGQKRYLEPIVDCVVRHVSMAIEQPNDHEECCSIPIFGFIVQDYPPKIAVSVKDWEKALKPLLHLQDRLLNTLKPRPCGLSQVMHELLLHLVVLLGNSRHIAVAQAPVSSMNEAVVEQELLMTEAEQNIPENGLDRCLSVVLSCIQKTNSVLAVDTAIIEHMSSLLAFDYTETVARVLSMKDAQKLIDCVDMLINDECFLRQCGRDAVRKAALLASAIYARVPLLPQSVFLNGPIQQYRQVSGSRVLEFMCQRVFISRILDHNYIVPSWWMCQEGKVNVVYGKVNESVDDWLKRSRPNFVTGTRVMLELARTIEYIHSMEVVALRFSNFRSEHFALDSNLHAKIMFRGFFAWQVRDGYIFDPEDYMVEFSSESNISAFADLFHSVCFDDNNENLPNHLVEDAKKLIEQCRAKDPRSRLTMENVVKEMETWNLISYLT